MARILAILLMVGAIWYGVAELSAGMGDQRGAPATLDRVAPDAPRGDRAETSRSAPVTQRVHDRVTAAMEERMRRQTGDR